VTQNCKTLHLWCFKPWVYDNWSKQQWKVNKVNPCHTGPKRNRWGTLSASVAAFVPLLSNSCQLSFGFIGACAIEGSPMCSHPPPKHPSSPAHFCTSFRPGWAMLDPASPQPNLPCLLSEDTKVPQFVILPHSCNFHHTCENFKSSVSDPCWLDWHLLVLG
jgi:hypothetical protein